MSHLKNISAIIILYLLSAYLLADKVHPVRDFAWALWVSLSVLAVLLALSSARRFVHTPPFIGFFSVLGGISISLFLEKTGVVYSPFFLAHILFTIICYFILSTIEMYGYK